MIGIALNFRFTYSIQVQQKITTKVTVHVANGITSFLIRGLSVYKRATYLLTLNLKCAVVGSEDD